MNLALVRSSERIHGFFSRLLFCYRGVVLIVVVAFIDVVVVVVLLVAVVVIYLFYCGCWYFWSFFVSFRGSNQSKNPTIIPTLLGNIFNYQETHFPYQKDSFLVGFDSKSKSKSFFFDQEESIRLTYSGEPAHNFYCFVWLIFILIFVLDLILGIAVRMHSSVI